MGDILRPLALVIPHLTTAVRDTCVPELGTIIYDSTQNKLCVATDTAVGSSSWELITSVQE